MFSFQERSKMIQNLSDQTFDLVIIGGGITGAGVALQAAASGLSVALVEMQDFAEGTSSRSTKLVHGGLRYLKTFDVEVVADTVSERAIIQGVAPHIPKADPMILPIYDEPGSTFNLFSVKVAMDLYDHLAGITGGKYANYMLSKEEILKREPQLESNGLLGGGVYLDYRNNDARLVIENIKRAVGDGAIAVSRLKVEEILHDEQGKVSGVQANDLLSNQDIIINSKLVINTAGPWSDFVNQLDKEIDHTPHMRPTKGVHLVVDGEKLKVPQPTYFDTGENDGRMVFVIPRESKTYFGTTDTDYQGDFNHPTVEQEDVDYLLKIVNRRYPEANLTIEDIEASWAGLRPLISDAGGDYNGTVKGKISDENFEKIIRAAEDYTHGKQSRPEVEKTITDAAKEEPKDNPSAVSRGSDLTIAKDGLLILSGGKLTDYRLMATGAMKKIISLLADDAFQLVDSEKYPVSGGEIDPKNVDEELENIAKKGEGTGLNAEEAKFLAELYGSNTEKVFALKDEGTFDGLSLAESMSLRYAMEAEMTLTPVDYLLRRTNYMLFISHRLMEIKDAVVEAMADYFEWSPATKEAYQVELEQQIKETQLTDLKKH
ncbi:type 1 glycerol-3-phosphate oxidase [Enterococcus raffinosus]|uniref:Alpha-glycerophosphate oxidase n=1 Tax=Enterococcus raffinosus TaxID=71452 RepID=A0AAW8T9Z1_9ENTE|nr:type 1 glycerol-3-phosphate oxidase [Enterococcus raffinosus]MDT2525005.1 type 1 glycerol-3-phosphate oxidase [Enterococcus raffinosus]MDT2529854.1 type 1 glycerol-3-phosphate oxidase [Enterococcus raffinosus]MDT2532877.1 type 1 glycerol-3-phosphate oxidase [Enterococcus raffinosus]MDT2543937.1 type 1 glycerol-3-phosphate oxidase [Enterococcus raffinosus]MDT2556521.1 type 1 glycerol-3-phosphate oxidase [Enterococcus raffinosus]